MLLKEALTMCQVVVKFEMQLRAKQHGKVLFLPIKGRQKTFTI